MGLFKSKWEKDKELEAEFRRNGGRLCMSFTSLTKDLNGLDVHINMFLREHHEYELKSMTSAIGPLGASVLCYFEQKGYDPTQKDSGFYNR